MLRPERMSRVSVTGSKRVMNDVIGAVHDLSLLDLTDYDGDWEGFDPGNPIAGADEASDRLVTVRALESTLGVTEADAGPTRIVTEEAIEEDLEEIRQDVNDLDDRRSAVEDDLRAVEEAIDGLEPFVALGIDLDLLQGYENLAVRAGQGDADTIERALANADDVDAYEVFTADDIVAVFVHPPDAALEDALVSADFATLDIPDPQGSVVTDGEDTDMPTEADLISPEDYLQTLRQRRGNLESRLETVEGELEALKSEVAGFLLAAEEHLSIDAQKREAPLSFATTENAFVAEGWIPTDRYTEFETALHEAAGDHVEVEELERAAYDENGHPHNGDGHEEDHVGEPTGGAGEAVTANGGNDRSQAQSADGVHDEGTRPDGGTHPGASHALEPGVAADGGNAMSNGEPPVVQDNPKPAGPFELLVEVVNRPNYHELDPTIVLWLTFPTFFGFMIGDVGYGILYLAIGYLLWTRPDSDALRSLGGVTLWAGGFTVLFGILYGELFGLHVIGDALWGGQPPMEKGLSPASAEFARLWLVVSVLLGILHLTVAWVLGFFNDLSHGLVDAVTENASWLLLLFGIWVWIFSGAGGNAPDVLVGSGSVLAHFVGFVGFPSSVGIGGLAVAAVGFVLLLIGEGGVGALESLNILVNVLSYTRIAAVLLAKAGMAFVVNLLFFGVYVTGHGNEAAWHFGIGHMPHVGDTVHGHEVTEVMFGGLLHGGIAAVVFGLVVLVFGHLLVLALGITSAGLQAIRLEYVEFFQKFYQGGGDPYQPFGHERAYTTED